MLSRIAESMFWIGRYVERAEDTARILDVQTQLLIEDTSGDREMACRNLLSIMGVEPPEDCTVDVETVLRLLAYDPSAPASVAAVLGAARESARRARETLSTDLYAARHRETPLVPVDDEVEDAAVDANSRPERRGPVE